MYQSPSPILMYDAYQACADLLAPWRRGARLTAASLDTWPEVAESGLLHQISAANELLALAGLSHCRPAFGISSVLVDGSDVTVNEEVTHRTPFCTLLHFKKTVEVTQPRVLLVAPMAGHFATLLRGTVRTMLADHDVYITDWHNARDVAVAHGHFGFAEYVRHLIMFLEMLGAGTHVVAVCQPTVAALAAVALMAEDSNPAQPRSLTLIAGPNDTRINPTRLNALATSRPLAWFERNLIGWVPLRFAGAMRRVYPGFLQLSAFMNMNLERHVKSLLDLYRYRAEGDDEKAAAIRAFYDEYLTTMDLPAEFYLDTVRLIFQEYALPLGQLEVAGRRIDPRAIRHTALLTIEGGKDDICAIGQTVAAQDMCSGLRPHLKTHYVQPDVGHYGVFNGRRWETHIYPIVREVIRVSG